MNEGRRAQRRRPKSSIHQPLSHRRTQTEEEVAMLAEQNPAILATAAAAKDRRRQHKRQITSREDKGDEETPNVHAAGGRRGSTFSTRSSVCLSDTPTRASTSSFKRLSTESVGLLIASSDSSGESAIIQALEEPGTLEDLSTDGSEIDSTRRRRRARSPADSEAMTREAVSFVKSRRTLKILERSNKKMLQKLMDSD